jgi:L-aspartate oxidase
MTKPIGASYGAIVIGTGISGLFTAIKLAEENIQTILLTKASLDESNSRYAQGGIAAVLPGNPSDSLELHVQDTLAAGAGLSEETAVRSILSEGWDAIEDLLLHGVPFDRSCDGEQGLALGREAAHSVPRILHAGGDATGHCVEMALIAAIKKSPLITVLESTPVTELLIENGHCVGCRAITLDDYQAPQERILYSNHTVLATGGIGRLYSHTTNPAVATGDGLALAYRAGARLQDLEFIQFHPTAFYHEGQVRFLVSEALRGEGGILRNAAGEAFASRYHPQAELAPRDIVTRAIFAEMQAAKAGHVWLDMTALPASLIEARFPTILKHAAGFNIDIRRDWIPVTPAAHYLMGGIATNTDGASSLPGLHAVGEVARTGLHGANRLASNSLLECVVLARRVARQIAQQTLIPSPKTDQPIVTDSSKLAASNPQTLTAIKEELASLMWKQVGILRDTKGLTEALKQMVQWEALATQQRWSEEIPDGLSLLNQLLVSQLIATAALARTESKGAHTRTDEAWKVASAGC